MQSAAVLGRPQAPLLAARPRLAVQPALLPLARPRYPLALAPSASRRSAASKADEPGEDTASSAGPAKRQRARQPSARQPSAAAAAAPPPAPYADALLQREYELWQRQSGMYERLQEAHDRDLQRFAEERTAWQQSEAALRQEAAELRAQLLYAVAQLNALQAQLAAGGDVAGGPGLGSFAPGHAAASSVASHYPGSAQQAALAGREPAAALPSSSGSRLSGAEQVRALIDAMKPSGNAASSSWAGSGQLGAAPASSSGVPVSPAEAWPEGAENEVPAYAADLAAAVAAVDTTDVLTGISNYSLGARKAAAAAAAAPEAAAPAAPVAPAAVPPSQPAAQPTAQAAPAAAPVAEEPSGAEQAAADRGPPPPLTLGADDIFWVNQLHTGLCDLGYYPGDEDIDDFYFGEGTQSALMTMQCCEGLEETGIADAATWAKLLGASLAPKPSRDLTADMMVNVPGLSKLMGGGDSSSGGGSAPAADAGGSGAAGGKPAYAELFTAAFTETVAPTPEGGLQDVQQLRVSDQVAAGGKLVSDTVEVEQRVVVAPGGGSAQVSGSVKADHKETYTEWPVLHEGDGGREVHALHVALERAGFYPSEDDERWWSFGDGTLAALKTFQACNGYPESGVCDAATWRLLLGQDAQPALISQLRSGQSDDEDLAEQSGDRVWLIGEQRWEDRSRVKRG